MYVPPAFQIDRAASLAFAAARGFGLVVGFDGARPVASPLPFHLDYACDGSPRIAFHVARGNPLAELAMRGRTWLVSTHGADAYVSPDWYASPDQVPTWLYQTVSLTGPVRPMAPDELVQHLDDVVEKFESWLAPKPPWAAERLTPARRKMLMKAITGITMNVEAVEGSFKLNQLKSDADQVAIVNALEAQDDPAARTIAAAMAALRPQLAYATCPASLPA
jgi:transcriptional regulator